jgi:uncharacterized protein YqgC (DUF456 family)
MTLFLWTAAIVLIVIGLIGALVPILPGSALVFLGLVLAAWADGFTRVGMPTLFLLALITVAVYVIDFVAGIYGVEKTGASRRAVWGAALGTSVGLFFGLPGLILGPFVGAVVGEYTVRRHLGGASRAGAGAWLGLALGTAAKIALNFVMLGIFLAVYLL